MSKAKSRAARRSRAADAGVLELQPVKGSGGVQYVLRPAEANPELFDAEGLTDDAVVDGALAGVLEELGERDEQAKVSVYKYVLEAGVRREAFAFECTPAEFTLRDLQETYGPGDYRIRIFGLQSGSNYRVNHFNKRITIGPTRQAARAAAAAALTPAPAAALPAQPGADIAKSITDSLAPILTGMMRMFEKFAGGDRKAQLEELRAMREIFLPAGAAPPADPLAQARSLLELKKILGSDAGEAGPYNVIATALEQFAPLLTARLQPPAGARQLTYQADAGAGVAAPDAAHMNLMLTAQLAVFLNAAKNNLEPETYATLFFENAPDDLMEAIQKPGWFEALVALAPEFANYRPWCEQMRALVLGYLAADTSDSDKLAHIAPRPLTADDPQRKTAPHGTGAAPIENPESHGE
jgi:hypothetical protein